MLKLNPQQFATIFEALRAAGRQGGNEKRQATRMDVQARVKVASLSQAGVVRCFSGLTRDISANGLGLMQSVPVDSGGRFLVCFPNGKGEVAIICIAKFCRALADGVFGVGAEFETLAGENLVEQFHKTDEITADRIKNSILA